MRVDEGIEGLVHISELAERHVEIPEQVVQVGDEILVKVIDIDLDRRRISLSLKQANEGVVGDEEQFDPAAYGMAASYDAEGNYLYPEGFDSDTGEWREGFDDPARGVGEGSTPRPRPASRRTASRSRPPRRPTPRPRPVAATPASDAAGPAAPTPPAPAARWPATRPWPRCGPSSPAVSEQDQLPGHRGPATDAVPGLVVRRLSQARERPRGRRPRAPFGAAQRLRMIANAVRGRPPEPARKLQVCRPAAGAWNSQRRNELRRAAAGRWNCIRSRTAGMSLQRTPVARPRRCRPAPRPGGAGRRGAGGRGTGHDRVLPLSAGEDRHGGRYGL